MESHYVCWSDSFGAVSNFREELDQAFKKKDLNVSGAAVMLIVPHVHLLSSSCRISYVNSISILPTLLAC